MRKIWLPILALFICLSLLGCGRVADEPTVPAANAGDDQTVFANLQCQLDGSLSSGNLASYLWKSKTVPTGATPPEITGAASRKAYFTPTTNGTYEFELELSNSLGLSTDAVAITVVPFQAPSIEAGFYGVCSHLQSHDGETVGDIVTQARMMDEAGIQFVRFDFNWKDIEPQDDQFSFAKYEAIVAKLKHRGVKGLGILDYDNTWSDPKNGRAEDINRFADFAYNTVKHFKADVKFWQIWNEPNNSVYWASPSAQNYTKLLKAAYGAVKQADPDGVVILGGFVGNGRDEIYIQGILFAKENFFDDFYAYGGKDYFDVGSIHPYTFAATIDATASLEGALATARGIMDSHGDTGKQLWLTELGPLFLPPVPTPYLSPDRGYSESEVAGWLTLIYTNLKGKCDKLFYFEFRDNPGPITIENQNWLGLTKSDFSPKAAYNAYKDLPK